MASVTKGLTRGILIDFVKAAGCQLAEDADLIAGESCDERREPSEMNIWIRIRPDAVPEIEVSASYNLRETCQILEKHSNA